MTDSTDGATFQELFSVIQDYAQRDHNHQVKALRVIAAAYLPLYDLPPCPTPEVVEDVLTRNDFLVTDPRAAGSSPPAWTPWSAWPPPGWTGKISGGGRLPPQRDGRSEAQGTEQGYETYVLDADEVLDGLETILAADIVEDVI